MEIKVTVRLREKYKKEITNTLKEKFNYKNDLEIPKLEKIVINMGVGEAVKDSKKIEIAELNTMTFVLKEMTHAVEIDGSDNKFVRFSFYLTFTKKDGRIAIRALISLCRRRL